MTNLYDFLAVLWRGGNNAYWWTDPNRQSYWFLISDDLKAARKKFPKAKNQNIYFGIHPVAKIPLTNSRGEPAPIDKVRSQNKYIACINCVYAEFDSLEEVNTEIPPSVIIFSGGGYHCYWLLDETFFINSDNDLAYAKKLQAQWVQHVGSDEAAKDLSRVLRVPGTLNLKPKYAPDFPTVEFRKCDLTLRYAIKDFEVQPIVIDEPRPIIDTSNIKIKDAWFNSAIEGTLDDLRNAANGTRNDTLNKVAFRIGQFVPHAISQTEAESLTMSAGIDVGLHESEINATMKGAIHSGMNNPDYGPQDTIDYMALVDSTPEIAAEVAEESKCSELQFNLADYAVEDGGVLDCWLEHWGENWLYVTGYKAWFTWTGTHWQRDKTRRLQAEIQQLLRIMNQNAQDLLAVAQSEDDKSAQGFYKSWIVTTRRSKSKISSIETMAQAQLATSAETLDAGNVLNLANGTLDLDTVQLREHCKGDHQTYCLPYAYDADAECPHYEKFISEVLIKDPESVLELEQSSPYQSDPELQQLFQELLGYSLTNSTQHEVMVWMSGEGGNGKSVCIAVNRALLGPLATSVDFQTVGQNGNYDLADIPGRRIIVSTEAERGGRIADGMIKRIVSGESIKARPIYGEPFEFTATAKIWWAMNDQPVISDTSNAMWRRLRLLPFYRSFTEKDKDTELLPRLLEELPGILNFALAGLHRLRRQNGFTTATAVSSAIENYKSDSNPVQQWVSEYALEEGFTLASELFASYIDWCKNNGRKPLNSTNFGKELKRLKIAKARRKDGINYALTLTHHPPPDEDDFAGMI